MIKPGLGLFHICEVFFSWNSKFSFFISCLFASFNSLLFSLGVVTFPGGGCMWLGPSQRTCKKLILKDFRKLYLIRKLSKPPFLSLILYIQIKKKKKDLIISWKFLVIKIYCFSLLGVILFSHVQFALLKFSGNHFYSDLFISVLKVKYLLCRVKKVINMKIFLITFARIQRRIRKVTLLLHLIFQRMYSSSLIRIYSFIIFVYFAR